jgi:hypothetical protein
MMKRLLQIVSVLVIALLAAQPALAGLTCNMEAPGSMACAPVCAMATNQMGMDCQMPQQVAGAGCMEDCCQHGLPQAVAQFATGAKPKAPQLLPTTLPMAPPAETVFAVTPPGGIIAATPPRYILFRVFRI